MHVLQENFIQVSILLHLIVLKVYLPHIWKQNSTYNSILSKFSVTWNIFCGCMYADKIFSLIFSKICRYQIFCDVYEVIIITITIYAILLIWKIFFFFFGGGAAIPWISKYFLLLKADSSLRSYFFMQLIDDYNIS